VARDGLRFLAKTSVDRVRESPIRVLVNWTTLVSSR